MSVLQGRNGFAPSASVLPQPGLWAVAGPRTWPEQCLAQCLPFPVFRLLSEPDTHDALSLVFQALFLN